MFSKYASGCGYDLSSSVSHTLLMMKWLCCCHLYVYFLYDLFIYNGDLVYCFVCLWLAYTFLVVHAFPAIVRWMV